MTRDRRYNAIKQALMQSYPSPVSGDRERHFNTLVALICGLAGAQSAHLSAIADHASSGSATQASQIMRFRRWLKHAAQTLDGWVLPIAKVLLAKLAHQPLLLAIDGSVVGQIAD